MKKQKHGATKIQRPVYTTGIGVKNKNKTQTSKQEYQ